MALFPQHPADGVHHIRFSAPVRADDARRADTAERHHGALAEGFKTYDFDFAQLKQDVPFCRIPLLRVELPHGQPSFFIQQGRGFCARKETTNLSSKGG